MKAFNLNWTNSMEGGRLIDTDTPYYHYSGTPVWKDIDDSMTLHIITNPLEVQHWDGKTYHTIYATGLMRSVETFGYGTFSADIMLPKGRNMFASFWLCGDGHWPDSGEIDILEAASDRRGSYFRWLLPSWDTTTNVHYLYEGRHEQAKAMRVPWIQQTKNPSERFIRYEAEWRPNAVIFRVNGKVVRTIGWEVTQYFAGQRMNVIFSVKPASEDFTMDTAMVIKSFKYEELS